MTCAAHKGSGVLKQRSYWLRCFWRSIFPLLALLACLNPTAHANVCVSPTLHVRTVHGLVTDQLGEPIAGATVMLKVGKDIKAETKTDDAGIFRLDVPSSHYELFVHSQGFRDSWMPLNVGLGMRSLFHSDALYVILAVGSLGCPPNVVASKREFLRQIQNFKAQFGAKKQEDATQK